MSPPCPLTNKLIENEIVEFKAGDIAYLLDRGVSISIDEFKECDIGNNVVIRIKTEDEKVDEPPIVKSQKRKQPKKIEDDSAVTVPFMTSHTIPEYQLSIDKSLFREVVHNEPAVKDESESSLSVEGVVAGLAMVLAIAQQIKQKKNEAQAQRCCTDSKIKFSEYDSRIKALDAKIDEKTKQESKTLHAELYEQYKELKELKDDASEIKDVISRLMKTITEK
jgi:hypothetical protein